jgi:hypothetical protein
VELADHNHVWAFESGKKLQKRKAKDMPQGYEEIVLDSARLLRYK